MARIPQGILGGIRGRVGNIVGGSWKGINYIRSMPLSVANPNTTSQQAQRGKFAATVAVARLLLSELVSVVWDPFAREMSGYNHFIQQNIDAFLTAGLSAPADFFGMRGILMGIDTPTVVSDASDNETTISWIDNTGLGDALATDDLFYVIYNETQDTWAVGAPSAATRVDATLVIGTSVYLENDVIRLWVGFGRPDLEKISDTAYATTVVVA